ncbi:hypothetical protein AX14_014049 [Amanita brunnescens Koide BX004]|nr:hypothetical protein AX14_014049 [Amanita brunnescens Koide BX004]
MTPSCSSGSNDPQVVTIQHANDIDVNPPIPSGHLPSHASTSISNTGEHGAPQGMAELLFASGGSMQDNAAGYAPHADSWYCIFRGREVGPIQGWDNLLTHIGGLNSARFGRYPCQADAAAAFERALAQPGGVYLL